MSKCGCKIVGEKQLDRLMRRYLGLAPENINSDEKEILLMALYMESMGHGGIAARVTAEGDARVAEAKAKLDAINASQPSLSGLPDEDIR